MIIERRRAWLVVLAACYLVGLGALYIHKPPNPDQAIFDYIGWVGSTGGKYYVDVAEQNFPGEMLLHDLAFRLFGVKFWAYRVLNYVLLLGGASALAGLLAKAGFGFGALIGAAFYVAGYVSSNAWMSGQRDVVAANLLLMVGYLFVRRLEGGSRVGVPVLGSLVFFALLLRPTYLLFVAGLLATDWMLRRHHGRSIRACLADAGLVTLMMLSCVGVLVGWSVFSGSWSAFREQAILFNFQAYSAGHSRLGTLGKLGAVGLEYLWFLPAVVVALRPKRWQAAMLVLIGLVILAPISAIAQNKGFGYHLGALIPPIFGLAGVGIWRGVVACAQSRSGEGRLRAVALLAIPGGMALLGLCRQAISLAPQVRYLLGRESLLGMMAREGGGQSGFTWANMFEASYYVRSNTNADDTILVWGRPVSIHLLAQRRSPTRFITSGMLVLAKPPFEGALAWAREFEDVLTRRPPRLVFLPTVADQVDYGAFLPDDTKGPVISALREMIATRYSRAQNFGSLCAYRLRD